MKSSFFFRGCSEGGWDLFVGEKDGQAARVGHHARLGLDRVDRLLDPGDRRGQVMVAALVDEARVAADVVRFQLSRCC